MKTQALEFREALKQLADTAGVKLTGKSDGPRVDKSDRERWLAAMHSSLIFFRAEFNKSSTAKGYSENRQLETDVLDTWELGYAPDVGEALAIHLQKNGYSLAECKELFLVDQDPSGGYFDKFRGRLMFPIRDDRGDLVGYGGRILGDGTPKYINSSDTPLYRKSRVLYGMHRAKDKIMKERHAVLVEGYLDVIACHRAGVTEAVASCGTALAEDQVRLIKRFAERVTILYDADKAGQKAAMKAVELFQAANLPCKVALMPPGEDPDTLLREKGPEAVRNAVSEGQSPFDFEVFMHEKQFDIQGEEFWEKLPAVLAKARNDFDLEKHLLRLASQHPTLRNATAAVGALRREVRQAKKSLQSETSGVGSSGMKSVTSFQTPLIAAEAVVFSAVLNPKYRQAAWERLKSDELFTTSTASRIFQGLSDAFPDGLPAGEGAIIVSAMSDETAKQALADLEFDVRVQELNAEYIHDSLKALEAQQQSRQLGQNRESIASGNPDDESLSNYLEKLKKIKGIG
jgi:DNA primase